MRINFFLKCFSLLNTVENALEISSKCAEERCCDGWSFSSHFLLCFSFIKNVKWVFLASNRLIIPYSLWCSCV